MLYPVTTLDPATAVGMHVMAPGHLNAIPLEVQPGDIHVINLVHIAPVQDFSIRAYVSLTPGGTMLGGFSEEANDLLMQVSFTLRRVPNQTLVVHDLSVSPEPGEKRTLVAVPPGTCFLNLINLVGSENAFSLAKSSTNVIP